MGRTYKAVPRLGDTVRATGFLCGRLSQEDGGGYVDLKEGEYFTVVGIPVDNDFVFIRATTRQRVLINSFCAATNFTVCNPFKNEKEPEYPNKIAELEARIAELEKIIMGR